MLYLEDYLEMIEHLPQELRDRFTEMREMDLQVHNATDQLDERVAKFFPNARFMKPVERDIEFGKLKEDYNKALEDADEKVNIANQVYELVNKYTRRLDEELHKFKMELEADNAGITEVLEKRSLELDIVPSRVQSQTTNTLKEKRKHNQPLSMTYLPKREIAVKKMPQSTSEVVVNESVWSSRATLLGHSPFPSASNYLHPTPERTLMVNQQPKTLYSTNSAQATTSQLLNSSQQLIRRPLQSKVAQMAYNHMTIGKQQQGYVTSTTHLKNSLEASNGERNYTRMITMNSQDIKNRVASPTNSVVMKKEPTIQFNRKYTIPQKNIKRITEPPLLSDDSEDSSSEDEPIDLMDTIDVEPEPKYCLCQQESYGDMIGCDNDKCLREWFHYQCVNITQPPKGKWYCPECSQTMKRRNKKAINV